MYHSSKLTIEYTVIIRTVIYKKEYNNITINTGIPVRDPSIPASQQDPGIRGSTCRISDLRQLSFAFILMKELFLDIKNDFKSE